MIISQPFMVKLSKFSCVMQTHKLVFQSYTSVFILRLIAQHSFISGSSLIGFNQLKQLPRSVMVLFTFEYLHLQASTRLISHTRNLDIQIQCSRLSKEAKHFSILPLLAPQTIISNGWAIVFSIVSKFKINSTYYINVSM